MHCVDLGESFPTGIFLQNWLRYSRERAYLISLILIRPWSFNFSRALPPPRHPSSWRGMRMISFNVRLLSLAPIILKSAGTMSHLLSRSTFLVALIQDHFDCSLEETWSPMVLTPDLLRMGRLKSAGAQPVAHPAAKKHVFAQPRCFFPAKHSPTSAKINFGGLVLGCIEADFCK